jgi:hypothetical protein
MVPEASERVRERESERVKKEGRSVEVVCQGLMMRTMEGEGIKVKEEKGEEGKSDGECVVKEGSKKKEKRKGRGSRGVCVCVCVV